MGGPALRRTRRATASASWRRGASEGDHGRAAAGHHGAERARVAKATTSRATPDAARRRALQVVEERGPRRSSLPASSAAITAPGSGPDEAARPTRHRRRARTRRTGAARTTQCVVCAWTGYLLAAAVGEHRAAEDERWDVGADGRGDASEGLASPSPSRRARRAARIVAAASALPPPSPAATGIRLSIGDPGAGRPRRRSRRPARAPRADPGPPSARNSPAAGRSTRSRVLGRLDRHDVRRAERQDHRLDSRDSRPRARRAPGGTR